MTNLPDAYEPHRFWLTDAPHPFWLTGAPRPFWLTDAPHRFWLTDAPKGQLDASLGQRPGSQRH